MESNNLKSSQIISNRAEYFEIELHNFKSSQIFSNRVKKISNPVK